MDINKNTANEQCDMTLKDFNCVFTICGSVKRYRNLMEEYQAYYTIQNNIVFIPVNYKCIQNKVETNIGSRESNKEILANAHKHKIRISDAIIVVVGTGYDKIYMGNDTLKELLFAYELGKKIFFTNIPENEREKYYFNNNKTYPLYTLKEEYK